MYIFLKFLVVILGEYFVGYHLAKFWVLQIRSSCHPYFHSSIECNMLSISLQIGRQLCSGPAGKTWSRLFPSSFIVT